MRMEKNWHIQNVDNIADLKNNITQDQLIALYSYILANEKNISPEEADILYKALSVIDDKFLEDEQ